ncbi:MAG: DUF998 domain-containing protein [Candidatus Bathyarchaeia archaeon]
MSERHNAVWFKISGICGFLTPITAFALIFAAIISYPEFNWLNNALSDLGIIQGVTAIFFNTGLIASGVLGFIFATGLFRLLRQHVVGKIGATIFIVVTIALSAIGIFPENIRPIHYIVSVIFFALLPIATLIITAAFWLMQKKRLALFTLLVAIVAATPWILYFTIHYAPNVAIPETLSAFAGAVWTVVISGRMLKKHS